MLILWVLAATVILVIGAIVVDVGLWLTERRKAQLAADFAALAAATELKNPAPAAELKGLEFAKRNGFDDTDPDVEVVVNPNYGPDEVEVTIKQATRTFFTGIFGVLQLDIGARAVGIDPADELDAGILLDRSGSMSNQDLVLAKNGARAALEVFDPNTDHVALAVLGASDPADPDFCTAALPGLWLPVQLSDDYKNGAGNLDLNSQLVKTINCLVQSPGQGTNVLEPVSALRDHLENSPLAQPGARQAIIIFVDTAPNEPSSGGPCRSAFDEADAAKALGIEVYTIGYNIGGGTCPGNDAAPYPGALATKLLADMATDSDDIGHCDSQSDILAENEDGDHFFCRAGGDDLAPIFKQIAEELTGDYRLEE